MTGKSKTEMEVKVKFDLGFIYYLIIKSNSQSSQFY